MDVFPAEFRKADGGGFSVENGSSDFPFGLSDCCTEGGLRNVQLFSGTAETFFFVYVVNVAYIAKHLLSPSKIKSAPII